MWDCKEMNTGPPRTQCGVMLNSDVILLLDLQLDANGKSSCGFGGVSLDEPGALPECNPSSTRDDVIGYDQVGN